MKVEERPVRPVEVEYTITLSEEEARGLKIILGKTVCRTLDDQPGMTALWRDLFHRFRY